MNRIKNRLQPAEKWIVILDSGYAGDLRLHLGLPHFGIWIFSGAWMLVLGIFLCVLCVLLWLKTLVIKRPHAKSRLLTPNQGVVGGPLKINPCIAIRKTTKFCRSTTCNNMQPPTFNLQHIEKTPFLVQSITLKKFITTITTGQLFHLNGQKFDNDFLIIKTIIPRP
jgi:hypothetical protein